MTLTVQLAGGARVQRTRALPAPSAHTDDLRTATFRSLDSMAFERARIRRLTLSADDLRPVSSSRARERSRDAGARKGRSPLLRIQLA
ncbi:hypothetical protein ACFVQ4_32655 [Streptomyces laurentii]|uniref:DinB/UmuC family translesion DNA polymerase n=1 Tax=Streptomyces laurentii TaxID=39478 RepID=UPI0036A1420B